MLRILFVLACVCVLSVFGQYKYISDCKSAGLCCEKANNTCFVPNTMRMDGTIGRCFCDAPCKRMKDCCVDFDTTCKARDCVMSEWEAWGQCDNGCGRGKAVRKRTILQDRSFGGKRCPTARSSKHACIGDWGCLQQSVEFSREEMTEVGYIMPMNFSIHRVSNLYSPQHDIRKNLFFKNFQDNIIPTKPVYRGIFRITHAGRNCKNTSWAKVLEKGTELCVECQPTSMNKRLERCRGHGVFNKETTWKAIEASNCHGKWKMIMHHESKTCNQHSDHDFVLV